MLTVRRIINQAGSFMIDKIISKVSALEAYPTVIITTARSHFFYLIFAFLLSFSFLKTLIIPSLALADQRKESAQMEDPDKGLPRSGVLSSTYSSRFESHSVGIWGKKNAAVDAKPPVSGSVSKISDRWVMRVFNNSTDAFDVDVRLKQTNSQHKLLRSDNYSLRLKPEESAERSVVALAGSSDAELELLSWKRRPAVKATPLINAGNPVATVTPTANVEEVDSALEAVPDPDSLLTDGASDSE